MMCASTINMLLINGRPQMVTQCKAKLIIGLIVSLIEMIAVCMAIVEIIILKLATLTKKGKLLSLTR